MVFIPFISTRNQNHGVRTRKDSYGKRRLAIRKQDDGHGTLSDYEGGEVFVYAGDTTMSASTKSSGGGSAITIPDGQPFAGRKAGGGTRGQIYGSKIYGSGYPDRPDAQPGVAGRELPFYFWPVIWTPSVSVPRPPLPAYIHLADDEFGPAANASRPGGPLASVSLPSHDAAAHTSFRLISDNSTITTLIPILRTSCSSRLSIFTDIRPKAFDVSFPIPKPEEAVQYYRGSSIALALDGYDNSFAVMHPGEAGDAALPTGTDMELMNCLNATIGSAAPLIGAAPPRLWTDNPMSGMGVSLIFVGVWWFFAML